MISHTHGAVSDNSCVECWWAHPGVWMSFWPALWTCFFTLKDYFCFFSLPHPTLTRFLKWAWHRSHRLTKVCVRRRCTGRWDLLWDPLISSKPSPGRAAGQVSQSTPHTRRSVCVRVKPVLSFMSQSLLHPGLPDHLACILAGAFKGASVGGNSCFTRGASWMHLLSSPGVLPFSFN